LTIDNATKIKTTLKTYRRESPATQVKYRTIFNVHDTASDKRRLRIFTDHTEALCQAEKAARTPSTGDGTSASIHAAGFQLRHRSGSTMAFTANETSSGSAVQKQLSAIGISCQPGHAVGLLLKARPVVANRHVVRYSP